MPKESTGLLKMAANPGLNNFDELMAAAIRQAQILAEPAMTEPDPTQSLAEPEPSQSLAEPDLSGQTVPPSTEPAPAPIPSSSTPESLVPDLSAVLNNLPAALGNLSGGDLPAALGSLAGGLASGLASGSASSSADFPAGFPSGFPGLSALKTSDDMKAILAGSNLKTALTKMAQNSEEMTKIVGSQLKNAPPEVMEQARKLAMGGQGDHIMKEMKKKGMDPLAMRAQMQQQKRAARGTNPKILEPTLAGIHINIARKAKIVRLSRASTGSAVAAILHTDKPVELSCSRLAQGPLADKIIKVWYDPNVTGKNRRTTKIVGFPIGSDVIVVAVDEDLTVAALEQVEKLLA